MNDQHAISSTIIALMKGPIYRDADEDDWLTLQRSGAAVRDHFDAIGIDVLADENEGYAYVRTARVEGGEESLPRLVVRRSLTYNVSLLLVLLRGRLVEFETSGSDSRLVVTRDQLLEMLRVFQTDTSDDARVADQIDRTIGKCVELGFLRALRNTERTWEVRRILKAYLDPETMADWLQRMQQRAEGASDD